MIIFFLVVAYSILTTVGILLIRAYALLATKAIVFSKLAISLLLGLSLSQSIPIIADNAFHNFGVWALIVFLVILLISLAPRINCSLQLLSTFFVSYFVMYFTLELVCGLFYGIFMDTAFAAELWMELVIKLIAVILALVDYFKRVIGAKERFQSGFMRFLERLVASVLYGVVFYLVFSLSLANTYDLAAFWDWIIFIVPIPVTFLIDLLTTKAPAETKK